MQIDKVVNTIKSESSGFYLLETTNSESISYLEEQILNSFYEKQYEIDTSFIILAVSYTHLTLPTTLQV